MGAFRGSGGKLLRLSLKINLKAENVGFLRVSLEFAGEEKGDSAGIPSSGGEHQADSTCRHLLKRRATGESCQEFDIAGFGSPGMNAKGGLA